MESKAGKGIGPEWQRSSYGVMQSLSSRVCRINKTYCLQKQHHRNLEHDGA